MFPPWRHYLTVLLSLTLAVLSTAETQAQSTLIPVSTRSDFVFDFSGERLYISTTDGFVQRYNISTGQLEAPFNVGGSLNSIDIARNNSFVLVAQNAVGVTQGTIHKINTSTGAVTNINYTRGEGEGGAFDVTIASNGIAFVTTNYEGSGWTPVHQINLATNAITVRDDVPGSKGNEVTNGTQIHRSADGTRLYFLEGDISSGPVFSYNATTDTFGASAETDLFPQFAAVNRNGTLVGTILYSYGASLDTAASFNYVHNFTAADSGVAFDALTDTVYLVNTSTNQIIAYDTNTFAEKFRLNISKQISFDDGQLVASPDGVHLALATNSGIELFDVRLGTPANPPTFGTPRDMVFDHAGQHLYITTAEGLVWPYNLSAHAFGTPINFGGSPYGLDITADDSILLVAQGTTGITQAAFQKVTLATGVMTNIAYPRTFFEGGSLDVAITSNGLALGTSATIHEIDPVTNAISERADWPGSMYDSKVVHRSADRTLLYFLESYGVYLYNASTNTFGPIVNTQSFAGSAAVNRNGMLLGTRLYNGGASLDTAPDFNFVHNFNTFDSGIAFDAMQDTIYGVSSLRNQIIAYDTGTFAEKFRFDIGEDVDAGATSFGPGNLVASQDSHYLALITPTTVRVFGLPAAPLTSVVSRKTHGTAGTFDIPLPLDGNPGVECRSGGTDGKYTLVFTFAANLTSISSASVSSLSFGDAALDSSAINPLNAKQYIVNLSGVTDQQYVQVTLNNVIAAGAHTDAVSQIMGVLVGDTSGNRSVNSGDIGQTKSGSGHTLTSANFREDVNTSGSVNGSDVVIVKSKSGNSLPDLFQTLNKRPQQAPKKSGQASAASTQR